MEYDLNVDGQTVKVSVTEQEDRRFVSTIGDKKYVVERVGSLDRFLVVSVDGRQIGLGFAEADAGRYVVIDGCPCFVQEESMQTSKRSSGGPGKKVPSVVTPPIPSVVVRVMVSEGDLVSEGRPVAVVSAMKMETTLYAPFDGRVVAVNFAEGDKVSPDDIIVDIERTEEATKENKTGAEGEGA